MKDDFGIIAGKYDKYNAADYDRYLSFVRSALALADCPVTEVLDLGCGTGELTVRLADSGYSVTAVDASPEMLEKLREKIGKRDIQPVCQDMTELDLYGTVQGAVSTYDCLNYLLSASELEAAIAKTGFFMEKGGIFVFDVNTDYAYTHVYANNSYVCEDGDDMLVWRNSYNTHSKRCSFWLTSFEYDGEAYIRDDAEHIQKNHSPKALSKVISSAGFDILAVYGGTDMSPLTAESPKAYYILKKNRYL